MEWTDAEAAAETMKGNQNAFRVLVERYSRPVFRLVYRMTGNEQDAEDVVQETFLRAYKHIAAFDRRATFSTWIYRIATNCSLDLLRARQVGQQHVQERMEPHESHGDFSNWLERLAADSPSPERLASSRQMATVLYRALETLTVSERAAFVLRHYEGLGIEDIASSLGIKQNAARQAVFRAVQKLRRSLECVSGAMQ